jgi:hypothetical protein
MKVSGVQDLLAAKQLMSWGCAVAATTSSGDKYRVSSDATGLHANEIATRATMRFVNGIPGSALAALETARLCRQ